MNSTLLTGSLLLLTLATTGCSSKLTQPEEYSGFLNDYSQLAEVEAVSGEPVLRWVDPNIDVKKYTSLYIEPSVIFPAPKPTEVISANTLLSITQYYDQTLKQQLGKSMTLTMAPGPNTIVMRPVITAVSSKTETLKPYEVIPIALIVAGVSTATGIRDQETTIATEAVFIDGKTNQVVAKVVRKGTGVPLENKKQKMSVDDTKALLDSWAVDFNQAYVNLKAAK
ncbi:hypothetical protein D3C76_161470 [compost metagenome]